MIDVREDILNRLVAIAATVPTIVYAQRNNVDLGEEHMPAAVVFDGDEETNDANDASMKPPNRPTLVHMTPAIMFAEMTETIGSDLSMLRRELIKRVLYDTALNEQIVETGRNGNGAIRYLGCQTDLAWMRSLHGVLQVQFLFKYALKPWDL